MLDKWLPDNTTQRRRKNASARQYLVDEIYSLRMKRAYTFLAEVPTLSIQFTQRNEGWHSKVKSLTSPPMPLRSFAGRLNDIVQAIDRSEHRDSVHPNRHISMKSSSLLPNNFLTYLEDINISKYASDILASKFASALRLYLASAQVVGSIADNNQIMKFDIENGLSNNDRERSSRPTVPIILIDSNTKKRKAQCPCLMQERMLLPCGHLLTTVLCCVRESWLNFNAS